MGKEKTKVSGIGVPPTVATATSGKGKKKPPAPTTANWSNFNRPGATGLAENQKVALVAFWLFKTGEANNYSGTTASGKKPKPPAAGKKYGSNPMGSLKNNLFRPQGKLDNKIEGYETVKVAMRTVMGDGCQKWNPTSQKAFQVLLNWVGKKGGGGGKRNYADPKSVTF